jgi:hypothetical protein
MKIGHYILGSVQTLCGLILLIGTIVAIATTEENTDTATLVSIGLNFVADLVYLASGGLVLLSAARDWTGTKARDWAGGPRQQGSRTLRKAAILGNLLAAVLASVMIAFHRLEYLAVGHGVMLLSSLVASCLVCSLPEPPKPQQRAGGKG